MHKTPNKNQGLRSRTSNAKILIIVVAVKKQNKWKSHKEVFRYDLSAEVEFI